MQKKKGVNKTEVSGFESHPPHLDANLPHLHGVVARHNGTVKLLRPFIRLKNLGYADSTLKAMVRKLKVVAKHADLDKPEAVNKYVADLEAGNGHKGNLVFAYEHYATFYGLSWEKPYYSRVDRLTKIPKLEDINKIIAKANHKYSLGFSILRDTGMRLLGMDSEAVYKEVRN